MDVDASTVCQSRSVPSFLNQEGYGCCKDVSRGRGEADRFARREHLERILRSCCYGGSRVP